MKEIYLSGKKGRGLFALVDDKDYERLNQYKWHLSTGYAAREIFINGEKKNIFMHRVINKTPKGMETDHINHILLDNQRRNLRSVTQHQNQCNSIIKNKTSNYRGIYWHKHARRWHVKINFKGKRISLGYYLNEIYAAMKYDEAALRYYGKLAHSNFRVSKYYR